jgi:hypothetical protein
MDSLADDSIKTKWGTNALYFRLPADTVGAKYTTGLRFAALGTKWWHDSR